MLETLRVLLGDCHPEWKGELRFRGLHHVVNIHGTVFLDCKLVCKLCLNLRNRTAHVYHVPCSKPLHDLSYLVLTQAEILLHSWRLVHPTKPKKDIIAYPKVPATFQLKSICVRSRLPSSNSTRGKGDIPSGRHLDRKG